jgi:hypothetical protein
MGNINIQFNNNEENVNEKNTNNEPNKQKQIEVEQSQLTKEQQNLIKASNTLFNQQKRSLIHLETYFFDIPPVRTSYALNVKLPNSPDVPIPPIQFKYPFL